MTVSLGASAYTAGLITFTADSGSDRMVILVESWEDELNSEPSAVTLGGISMTVVISIATPNGNAGCSIWRLMNATIPAGSNNFIITRPQTPNEELVGRATYLGVEQTTPIADTDSASTNANVNNLTNTLTVALDSMSVARSAHGEPGTWTWANSYVDQLDHQTGDSSASAADKAEPSAGTSTPDATHVGNLKRMALCSCSIDPSAAPPPITPTIFYPCCAQLIE